ncbi:Ca(2+)-dependent cysteine protease [Aspergillus melleus]|uniref:Ca(2+)-dependent cysteine protease n=1 Tax=Aspergillus melleus TaxID=138277 RepID=A0ACC3ATR6_9EURO|nr:Ca(2+)-dependent cysteine protease [Aspergillus melleus]
MQHHHHQSSYGGGYPGQAYRQQPPPSNPYPSYGQPSPQSYGSHPPQGGYGGGPPSGYNSPAPNGGHMYQGQGHRQQGTLSLCVFSLGAPNPYQNSYGQGNHGGHGAPAPPPSDPVAFGHGAPQGYNFQYSRCTGKRKALLIGINYFNQKGQLRGCINDVKNMSSYLNQNFGYAREDMVLLTDDQQNPMSQPTKANILRAMHWLVKDARPNDSLFFHYSGKSFIPRPMFRLGLLF